MFGQPIAITRRMRMTAQRLDDLHEIGTSQSIVVVVVSHLVDTEPDILMNVNGLTIQVVETKGFLPIPGEAGRKDCFIAMSVDERQMMATFHGWAWGDDHGDGEPAEVPLTALRRTRIPVWRQHLIRPKTNEERVDRKRAKTGCVQRKIDDRLYLICPKCGWVAKHLTIPYYDSPWTGFGGLCSECCVEACKKFDAQGWPDPTMETTPDISTINSEKLAKRTFGLLPPVKSKRHDPSEADPNQTHLGFNGDVSPGE